MGEKGTTLKEDLLRTATGVNVTIKPPNLATVLITVEGTSDYVQHKFGKKSREQMIATQKAGDKAKAKNKKEPRNFARDLKEATYLSAEGWHGIPAPAFRNAMISACRVAGFTMTRAKLAFWIEADGYDENEEDPKPLVRITKGKPVQHGPAAVRNDNGSCDLRVRPLWKPGWRADVRVTFDADMFEPIDVANLLMRAGLQVGVGEGRNDSKKSCGMGWGSFRLVSAHEMEEVA